MSTQNTLPTGKAIRFLLLYVNKNLEDVIAKIHIY